MTSASYPAATYSFIMEEAEKQLSEALQTGRTESADSLINLLSEVTDLSFLKQLSNSLLLKITASDNRLSTIDLTEWLLNVNRERNLEQLKLTLCRKS